MKLLLVLLAAGAMALKQGPAKAPIVASKQSFEDALVAALRASKGRSSPETKALVAKIQQLLDDSKPAIKTTLEGLQATVSNAATGMSDCGGDEMQQHAAAFEQNFTTKSTAHKTCRQTEKANLDAQKSCESELATLTDTQKTTCDAFAALEKTMYDYKSSCEVQTGETFEAYHTRLVEASQKKLTDYKKLKEDCTNAKTALEAKGPECTTALKTYENQKANCDSVQDAMDSYSCSQVEAATAKCEAAGECYNKAVSNYESVKATSMTELDSLKKEWRAILRMECIIKIFELEEAQRSSAIDTCQAQDMNAQTDTDLPLQLSSQPAQPACHVPTGSAGSAAYMKANYDGLPADAPAKGCVASCCQQSAGIAGLDFSGLGTSPSGQWHLALNIDTNDGNVVAYPNVEFWESSTGLGGASSNKDECFTRDFKDAEVFDKQEAKELLIVCHDEGKALGWRTWKLTQTRTLQAWFNIGNTCAVRLGDCSECQMASETTGGDVGNLIEWEPLIKNSHSGVDNLYVNARSNDDFNRLAVNPGSIPGNKGAGLGTQYDSRSCSDNTARPQADAEMRSQYDHWGSGGGVGGLIGSDHNCHSGCPWTISSGYNYDYAIFVM